MFSPYLAVDSNVNSYILVLGRLGLTEANGADQLLPNKLRHFLKTGGGGNSGGTATTSDTGDSNMPQSSSNQTISSEDIVILTREEQVSLVHYQYRITLSTSVRRYMKPLTTKTVSQAESAINLCRAPCSENKCGNCVA